jgi:glycosyltransferase involved in cell wall biosynthesis
VYRHGGDAFLTAKLKSATFVHTTTSTTASLLRTRCPEARIVIARRGLEELPAPRNGSHPAGPLRLLSVGRLVPKKGHALQLAACAELRRRGVPVQARIVGHGPMSEELKSQITRLGLTGQVELPGEVAPEKMSEQYRWADVLWHTGVVDAEGDRDGLPNVIPEAWAHGLAVVSSDAGGAAEAVAALTVPAGDAPALVAAVEQLSRDAALRQRLGENGRRWVEENFLISRNAEILARAFHDVARQ